MRRFSDLPLRIKLGSGYIAANLVVFVINIFLLAGINSMSREMGMVYQDNRHLNELSESLDMVQESMTTYLNSKTSDSLEDYYRSAQAFSDMADKLNEKVTDMSFSRMERNIKWMSQDYLDEVSQTIEAKRGRNVEKYRSYYESSTELYKYISSYITSLNLEQFVSNSEYYTELWNAFRTFEIVSLAVLFTVMAGNVIMISHIARNMTRPLNRLAGSANEVADGNFDIDLPEVSSQDEVGIVTNAFNKMVVSIKQYIEQLRESMEKERDLQERELLMESHLKDAQLKYLQAQINPHFLFNTLNAGAQLAMMEGADRTYEYVQTVADFFRYNVKKQDSNVTVGEEVELVDNYIGILNVRFSGDIHYEKQIDERLLSVEMPSMILQPIVENAVNHGIREMGGTGRIRLSVYRDSGRIRISIKDNGIGMSAEEIDALLNGEHSSDPHDTEHNGIGMDNVISRLRLFAGIDDVIELQSEGKDKGLEVIIGWDLPVDERKENE